MDLQAILAKHAAWLRGDDDGGRANLSGANLSGAYLIGANLSSADLSGAKGIIDGGHDARGYRFVGVQHNDGWYVFAGCRRWRSMDEVINHYADREIDRRECLERARMIYAIAELQK